MTHSLENNKFTPLPTNSRHFLFEAWQKSVAHRDHSEEDSCEPPSTSYDADNLRDEQYESLVESIKRRNEQCRKKKSSSDEKFQCPRIPKPADVQQEEESIENILRRRLSTETLQGQVIELEEQLEHIKLNMNFMGLGIWWRGTFFGLWYRDVDPKRFEVGLGIYKPEEQ